jgi:hypothetical protein
MVLSLSILTFLQAYLLKWMLPQAQARGFH